MDYKMLVNRDNLLKFNFIASELVEVNSEYKNGIQLENKTYEQFKKMKQDALKYGYEIDIMSGYRTHSYQEKLFNDLVNEKGYNYAYKYIAVPGSSEHETGLALDFCIYRDEKCYTEHDIKELEETKWIHTNCYKYGFILRYPIDKEDITKYNYEPWHLRYVGDIASYLYNNNLTLEEYYL